MKWKLPRISIWQMMLMAVYCALVAGLLRASWDVSPSQFIRVAFSPDGQLLMTNSDGRGIEIWNLKHRWPIPQRMSIERPGLREDPHAIGFLSNDTIFVVSYETENGVHTGTNLQQWDVKQNKEVANLRVDSVGWQCAVALQAKVALTHSRGDSQVDIWDLDSGRKMRTLTPTGTDPLVRCFQRRQNGRARHRDSRGLSHGSDGRAERQNGNGV